MPSLRVCHAIGTSEIGGTERFLLDLIRAHRAMGIASSVCVMDAPGALAGDYASHASRVAHLDVSSSWLTAVRRWREFIRQVDPSVIVLYGARANLLGRMFHGRVPVLSALRSTVVDDRGARVASVVDAWTFSRLTACISNSRAALDGLLDRGYPAERLAYVPPGIDRTRFAAVDRVAARSAFGLAPTDLVLLSVANLKALKNHAMLIDVSAALRARGISHRLWLVGDGPERHALEAQVLRSHPAPESVVFAGREADPSWRLAAADLFVLASNWEGAPTAVLEAMAAGLPIVATDVGDVREYVTGDSGITVPPGDVLGFQRAVEALLDGRSRAVAAESARVRSRGFSAETAAAQYAEIFQWAVDRAGPLPYAYRPPRPRKVFRVLSRLNIGGPTIHVVLLSRLMRSHGVTTKLVAGTVGPNEGDMGYFAAEQGVAVHSVPALGRSVNPLKDVFALVAILRLLGAFRPEIVHTHASKGGAIGRLAAVLYNVAFRGRSTAIVHTYHGHTFEGYFGPHSAWLYRTIERTLARFTDRVIVLSDEQYDDVVRRFAIADAARTRVVPLGLDLRRYFAVDDATRTRGRSTLSLSDGEHAVLIVGRLTAIKNHALLLRAFRAAASRLGTLRLFVIGDGELRSALQHMTVELGIEHRTTFLGWRRDLDELFAAADVVALSSNNEGTPVALIEAIAAGCPVVATRVGGVPAVVDESSGMLVSAGDVAAFADALVTVAGRGRLPVGVRSRMQRFGIDRLVDDLLSLYREVLRSGAARTPEAR